MPGSDGAAVYSGVAISTGTDIDVPDNKYSVSDDVKLGREAAAQVEQRMPILPEGGDVDDYVERVGQRLVNGIPREFRHSQFDYEFDVVNARDINAFALPGGPLYINRGTIEAAGSEGELAGVTDRRFITERFAPCCNRSRSALRNTKPARLIPLPGRLLMAARLRKP